MGGWDLRGGADGRMLPGPLEWSPQHPFPLGNYLIFLWVCTLPTLPTHFWGSGLHPVPPVRWIVQDTQIRKISSCLRVSRWPNSNSRAWRRLCCQLQRAQGWALSLSPSTWPGVRVWCQELLQPFCHHERSLPKDEEGRVHGGQGEHPEKQGLWWHCWGIEPKLPWIPFYPKGFSRFGPQCERHRGLAFILEARGICK